MLPPTKNITYFTSFVNDLSWEG